MSENTLAWVHDKRVILTKDRLRWLEIMQDLHTRLKETKDVRYKEMMKFCGEQSREIKKQLSKLK